MSVLSGSGCDKRRKLCSLGTGEVVHITHLKCKEGMMDQFERRVQCAAAGLYQLEAGISDVRVCHPHCGEVCFVLTFCDRDDMTRYREGPELDMMSQLQDVVVGGKPQYESTGCLMPHAHSLASLVDYLEKNVVGTSHTDHNVAEVAKEMGKWFPRASEYAKYIHWDENDPKKYTRNIVFQNKYMDVLFMCWPPHSASSIHDHDASSCWVVLVEGEVHEVQYAMPKMDRQFLENQMRNPTGAVGRCGKLKEIGVSVLSEKGCTLTYANNDVGLHRVENRTDKPAYTVHVYAPGLRKMRIFKCGGEVCLHTVAAVPHMSEDGKRTGLWQKNTDPDGVIDVCAWNEKQEGSHPHHCGCSKKGPDSGGESAEEKTVGEGKEGGEGEGEGEGKGDSATPVAAVTAAAAGGGSSSAVAAGATE